MINGAGTLVNVNKPKVATTMDILIKFVSIGPNRISPAATTIPALAALMPSSEAFTTRYFLRSSQNRIIKKMRKVPGKKIPAEAIKPPRISPQTPYSRIASEPMYALKTKVGPGSA